MKTKMNPIDVYAFLDKAPLESFHFKILLLCSSVYGLTGMNVMLISALANSVAAEWNLSVIDMGYLLSIGYLGMFVGALTFGGLSDIIGRKKVLVIVVTLETIFTALCGSSPNLPAFYVIRFTAGLGLGGALPLPGVYISEYISARYRGLFLGLVETSWVYGSILSLLIPYFILPIFGWRITFYVALFSLPLIPLILFFLPESIRYLIRKGKFKEAQDILAKLKAVDVIDKLNFEETELGFKKTSIKGLLSDKYFKRTVMLFILWGALVYTYHGIFLWLPTIYAKQFSLKDVTSIWWTLIVTLFQIPGYYSASFLLDRVGRKKVLIIYLSAAGISSAFLSLIVSLDWILLWSAIIAFFNLGAWAGLYTYTQELYPTEARGTGSGAAASFGRLVGISAPSFTAYLFITSGIFGPFAAFSVIHLFAAFSVIVLGIETRMKPLEKISGF